MTGQDAGRRGAQTKAGLSYGELLSLTEGRGTSIVYERIVAYVDAAVAEAVAIWKTDAIEGMKYKNRYMAMMERLDMASRRWGLEIPEGQHPFEWDMIQRIIEYADTLAEAVKERDAEIARLRAAQFLPMGDNHHNALLCPYCAAERRR